MQDIVKPNLISNIPLDVVNYILSFDKRFIIRKGQVIEVNRIDKTDKRYELLKTIPPKQQIYNETTQSHSAYVFIKIKDVKRKGGYFEKDIYISYIENDYSESDTIYDVDTIAYDEKGNSFPIYYSYMV